MVLVITAPFHLPFTAVDKDRIEEAIVYFTLTFFNQEINLGDMLFLFIIEVNVFNLDIILRKIGTNKQEVEQRVLTLLSIMPKPNRN